MIAKLTGLVDSLGLDSAVIDVAGVGYLIFASKRTLSALPPQGFEQRVQATRISLLEPPGGGQFRAHLVFYRLADTGPQCVQLLYVFEDI